MIVKIQKYGVSELAYKYGIDYRVFKNWIEPYKAKIGVLRGRLYNPKQVRIIFALLGLPDGKKYNRSFFARLFKITRKLFNTWVEPFKNRIGVVRSKIYTPKQAKIIIQSLS